MVTYTLNHPEKGLVSYTDNKRFLWLSSVFMPSFPMHFIVLIAIAWFVGTHDLTVWSILALAITAGSYSGLGINTAREMGKVNIDPDKRDKIYARFGGGQTATAVAA